MEVIVQHNLTPEGILIKAVDGFHGYGITVDGRAWSCCNKQGGLDQQWKELKPNTSSSGYTFFMFYRNRKGFVHYMHRLVAGIFIGIETGTSGMQVNHINGDKSNNHLFNLEWVTPRENIEHAKAMGLHRRGELNGRAKLTRAQVDEIELELSKMKFYERDTAQRLAKTYSVSIATIYRIKNKTNWSRT